MNRSLPGAQDCVNVGKEICAGVFQKVKAHYESDRDRRQKEAEGGQHKDRNNRTREIDKYAQRVAKERIVDFGLGFQHNITILGEETRRYPESLERHKNLVAFVDPIDGTDLVVRGFGNWCLALLFFYPPERRILASIVGHSSGDVYYATEGEVRVETRKTTVDGNSQTTVFSQNELARNPDEVIRPEDAGICFYGQKADSFLAVAEAEGLMELVKGFRARMKKGRVGRGERIDMRLYNFGGNPMMAKLAAGDVDCVLGLTAQEVHDVLPGAYIATRAGALFTTLDNRKIDVQKQLLFPRRRFTYLLSASRQLHNTLLTALRK